MAFLYAHDLAETTCFVRSGLCWRKHTYLSRKLSSLPHVEVSIIELQTSCSPVLLGSIYVQPSSPANVIRQLVSLAETHELIIAGDFNCKGSFNFEDECLNTARRKVDAFLTPSDSTSSFFPSTSSFLRIHDDGTVHSSMLNGIFYPTDSCLISLSNPFFNLERDHALASSLFLSRPNSNRRFFQLSPLPNFAQPSVTPFISVLYHVLFDIPPVSTYNN